MLPVVLRTLCLDYYWSHYYYLKWQLIHQELKWKILTMSYHREMTLYYHLEWHMISLVHPEED